MAIKNNVKVFYFQDAVDVTAFLAADGRLERGVFLEQWKGIAAEHKIDVTGLPPSAENVDGICPKLEAASVFFIARRKLADGADMVYFSTKTLNNVVMLAEVGFRPARDGDPNPAASPPPAWPPAWPRRRGAHNRASTRDTAGLGQLHDRHQIGAAPVRAAACRVDRQHPPRVVTRSDVVFGCSALSCAARRRD